MIDFGSWPINVLKRKIVGKIWKFCLGGNSMQDRDRKKEGWGDSLLPLSSGDAIMDQYKMIRSWILLIH